VETRKLRFRAYSFSFFLIFTVGFNPNKMKKQLLTLLAALGCAAGFAQSIPNGNFENWTNSSYEVPQYWMCSNDETHDGVNAPPNT